MPNSHLPPLFSGTFPTTEHRHPPVAPTPLLATSPSSCGARVELVVHENLMRSRARACALGSKEANSLSPRHCRYPAKRRVVRVNNDHNLGHKSVETLTKKTVKVLTNQDSQNTG